MIQVMAKNKPAPTPIPEEPQRIRMIVDTEDEVRQAVGLRAIKMSLALRREVSKSEVVTELLREALRPEIAELRDKPFQPKAK